MIDVTNLKGVRPEDRLPSAQGDYLISMDNGKLLTAFYSPARGRFIIETSRYDPKAVHLGETVIFPKNVIYWFETAPPPASAPLIGQAAEDFHKCQILKKALMNIAENAAQSLKDIRIELNREQFTANVPRRIAETSANALYDIGTQAALALNPPPDPSAFPKPLRFSGESEGLEDLADAIGEAYENRKKAA